MAKDFGKKEGGVLSDIKAEWRWSLVGYTALVGRNGFSGN